MAQYQGISRTIFDEPEYRNPVDLLVAIWIMTNRDMAGVCPFRANRIASDCRSSVRKINNIIDYFASVDKLWISKDRTHIWWRSGIYHSLYKGKYSSPQLKNVVHLLVKWSEAKVFGEIFILEVAQVYERKYSLTIPYPKKFDTLSAYSYSYIHSYVQTESESQGDNKDDLKIDGPRKIREKIESQFCGGEITELEYYQQLIKFFIDSDKTIPENWTEKLTELEIIEKDK